MKIPLLVGPTSSGKTSVGLEVCKRGAQIISADSRQVYKFLDIGTGKLPINNDFKIEKGDGFWKINGVIIWGYDLVFPNQKFNAFEFTKFAREKINNLHVQNIPVIVVGGTGFFVDSLTDRIKLDAPKANEELRQSLNNKSLDELLIQLQKLSQKNFETIDQNNKVRVVRAIEKIYRIHQTKSLLLHWGLNLNIMEYKIHAKPYILEWMFGQIIFGMIHCLMKLSMSQIWDIKIALL